MKLVAICNQNRLWSPSWRVRCLKSKGDVMSNQDLKHETLVFARTCAAPVERVFAAFADPVERANWGTPSETAAFFYDKVDFREGGTDVFRCGDKSNPQYRGVTTYYDIVSNERIVSSETVETQGRKLLISMAT